MPACFRCCRCWRCSRWCSTGLPLAVRVVVAVAGVLACVLPVYVDLPGAAVVWPIGVVLLQVFGRWTPATAWVGVAALVYVGAASTLPAEFATYRRPGPGLAAAGRVRRPDGALARPHRRRPWPGPPDHTRHAARGPGWRRWWCPRWWSARVGRRHLRPPAVVDVLGGPRDPFDDVEEPAFGCERVDGARRGVRHHPVEDRQKGLPVPGPHGRPAERHRRDPAGGGPGPLRRHRPALPAPTWRARSTWAPRRRRTPRRSRVLLGRGRGPRSTRAAGTPGPAIRPCLTSSLIPSTWTIPPRATGSAPTGLIGAAWFPGRDAGHRRGGRSGGVPDDEDVRRSAAVEGRGRWRRVVRRSRCVRRRRRSWVRGTHLRTLLTTPARAASGCACTPVT